LDYLDRLIAFYGDLNAFRNRVNDPAQWPLIQAKSLEDYQKLFAHLSKRLF
jgi:hypothetical protein